LGSKKKNKMDKAERGNDDCFSFALDTDGLRQINKGRRKRKELAKSCREKKRTNTEQGKGDLRDAGACERINKHTGRMEKDGVIRAAC